ncbi:MAG: hypothetical protein PHQ52_05875 [Candidatus Omnitrophica bacterium]|nr:hypothetical protein [Candidatus Omnitrophota bacterium]
MFDFSIAIAGKKIRFKYDGNKVDYDPLSSDEFKLFVCNETEKEDLLFNIEYGNMPDIQNKRKVFGVDDSWALSVIDDGMVLEYKDRNLEGRIERMAVFDKEMTKGTIYINKEKTPEEEELSRSQREFKMSDEDILKREQRKIESEQRRMQRYLDKGETVPPKPDPSQKKAKKEKTPAEKGKTLISELKANFFQAFLVEYVAKKHMGIIAHCSTVNYKGKTYIFMGTSGTGKSTIAEFWHDKVGATVFNDDRAVIRVENGKTVFYNAPWVGTLYKKAQLDKGSGTAIDGVFLLYQHTENLLEKTSKAIAATKIFKNTFPVFWNRNDLQYILGVCADITKTVPCYDLGFINDDSVVDYLMKELGI